MIHYARLLLFISNFTDHISRKFFKISKFFSDKAWVTAREWKRPPPIKTTPSHTTLGGADRGLHQNQSDADVEPHNTVVRLERKPK